MKKILLFVVLTALLVLFGCTAPGNENESNDSTETDTEQVTQDTSVTTNDTTVTTDSENSDAEVTTEEETTARPVLSFDEHKAEIYRKTDGGKVVIGGYITPADMNVTEIAFKNLLDGGINTMVTGNEFYGQVMITNTLRIADRLGMDIAIQTYGQIYSKDELADKLKLSAGHKSVKYIYLCDEPLPEQFTLCASKTKRIRELYADEGWKIGSNMYPAGVLDNMGGWYTCSRNYVNKTKSDFLCFDFYPFRTNADYMDIYLETVAMEKKICDEFGIEMLAFLQTSSWDDAVLPSEGQLRFQTNVTLAMGADGMFCFTCCDSTDKHRTIINPDGSPTEFYNVTSAVFNDVHAMKGVFLPYSMQKAIVVGDERFSKAISTKYPELLADDGKCGSLTQITGEHVFIGCMTDKDGREGFYVVNSDYNSAENQTVSLKFNTAHPYQLWNGAGLDKMGEADEITVELLPGGACFVALDLSQDSYDYPEPEKKTDDQDTPIHEAKQNEMLFDLGFDSEGKVVNKADNNVSVKKISKGTYEEVNGVPALTNYTVFTTDIKDGAKYGVTVEMYVCLKSTANKKWVTFFYDPSNNCNLHRIFEKNGEESLYLGSYSDGDSIITGASEIEKVLPTNEWLHIVCTFSDKGQYLYVNGELVLEGHHPHNIPDLNCFIFDDPKKGCDLNTARVYAYVADAEQVGQMYSAFKK